MGRILRGNQVFLVYRAFREVLAYRSRLKQRNVNNHFRRTLLRYHVFVMAWAVRSFVRLSVCRMLSVTLLHPTEGIELFGDMSAPSNSMGTSIFVLKF